MIAYMQSNPSIGKNNDLESRRRGFTLTEIAIVLGIIGLILGAIWTAAAAVYANQRIASADTAVLQIAQGVRALYASSSSTGYGAATDITSALISSGSVPNNLISSTALVGPFPAGATQVSATADGQGFVIAMSGLTTSACINLETAVGGNSRDPGLYNDTADATAIKAGTAAATATAATGTPFTTAATPLTANAAVRNGVGGCNAAASGLTTYFGFTIK